MKKLIFILFILKSSFLSAQVNNCSALINNDNYIVVKFLREKTYLQGSDLGMLGFYITIDSCYYQQNKIYLIGNVSETPKFIDNKLQLKPVANVILFLGKYINRKKKGKRGKIINIINLGQTNENGNFNVKIEMQKGLIIFFEKTFFSTQGFLLDKSK